MGEYKVETQAVLNRIQNDIGEYTDLIEKMKSTNAKWNRKSLTIGNTLMIYRN